MTSIHMFIVGLDSMKDSNVFCLIAVILLFLFRNLVKILHSNSPFFSKSRAKHDPCNHSGGMVREDCPTVHGLDRCFLVLIEFHSRPNPAKSTLVTSTPAATLQTFDLERSSRLLFLLLS